MIELTKIIFSLIPVIFFLIVLIIWDSYKIVKFSSVILTIFYGCLVALFCLILNKWILHQFQIKITVFTQYLAPFIEELFKSILIFGFIRLKRIGFLVDGAILGFGVGAGFALTENLYYLHQLQSPNLLMWIVRGFGTAIMHGGTTAIFALVAQTISDRFPTSKIIIFIPAFLFAYALHSFFNHFFFSPLIMTILQLIFLPLVMIFTFSKSEKYLQEWLEVGMDVDVWLLDYINSGRISQTKIGRYLYSLRNQLPGEIVADILCYIRTYLELAIRAKGMLMMKEVGFKPVPDSEIEEKLHELKYLEKSIGKTSLRSISPLLHTNAQDLWQLYLLDK